MKKGFAISLIGSGGLLLLLGGLMASCAPDTSAPASKVERIEPAQATRVAVNLPATVEWVEPFTDQACLDCHTNEEQLTLLALPDEPTETLSEGPG